MQVWFSTTQLHGEADLIDNHPIIKVILQCSEHGRLPTLSCLADAMSALDQTMGNKLSGYAPGPQTILYLVAVVAKHMRKHVFLFEHDSCRFELELTRKQQRWAKDEAEKLLALCRHVRCLVRKSGTHSSRTVCSAHMPGSMHMSLYAVLSA